MQVRDPLFTSGSPFFDPRDLVQVKYELLRRVRVDGDSVSACHGAVCPLSSYLLRGSSGLGTQPASSACSLSPLAHAMPTN